MKEEKLEKLMDKKWFEMLGRNPSYNRQFLYAMHKLLDWYEVKLKQ